MFWLISMAAPFLSLVFPILLPSLAFAQLLKCISTTTTNGRPCRGGRPCHDSSTTEQREQHEGEKKEEPNLEDLRQAILLSFAEGAESSSSSSSSSTTTTTTTTTTPPVGEEKDNDDDDENNEKPTPRVKTVYAVPQQLIRDETNNRTKLSIDVAGFSWNNDLKITFDEKLYLLTIQGERTNTLGDAIVLQRAVFLNKDLHEKDSIFAECNENVLTVTIAKKERTPVTVPIHQNEASRSTTGKEEAEAEEANEEVEVETVQNDDD